MSAATTSMDSINHLNDASVVAARVIRRPGEPSAGPLGAVRHPCRLFLHEELVPVWAEDGLRDAGLPRQGPAAAGTEVGRLLGADGSGGGSSGAAAAVLVLGP